MKKVVLTSLLAVFAVSAANAANIINDNPLYRPTEGKFYSVTALDTDTAFDTFALSEEFGYGITDKLAVVLDTTISETDGFDFYGWNTFGLGANYRVLDQGNWKMDLLGNVRINGIADQDGMIDSDYDSYTWTAGVRGGYATDVWTVAGFAKFGYTNDGMFTWGDDAYYRTYAFGIDGQYVIDDSWNLVGQVNYTLRALDSSSLEDAGMGKGAYSNLHTIGLKLGVNYNIDATKYVGVYASTAWGKATFGNDKKGYDTDMEQADEYGLGVKFGVQF